MITVGGRVGRGVVMSYCVGIKMHGWLVCPCVAISDRCAVMKVISCMVHPSGEFYQL